MNDQIRLYEELSFNAHPSLQTQYYDGWLLRFSGGYTCRANSVNMLWPSSLDLNSKIGECEKRYFRQFLPCVFKITDGTEPELDQILEAHGYRIVTPTDLMILNMKGRRFARGDSVITDYPAPEWLNPFFILEKRTDPAVRSTAEQMLRAIRNEVLYCRIERTGRTVACASAVMERGYAALLNVIVEKSFRGNGYGRQLCESLLAEAVAAGVHTAYLQVVQNNSVAVRLYEKLGFRRLYSYWYRLKECPSLPDPD